MITSFEGQLNALFFASSVCICGWRGSRGAETEPEPEREGFGHEMPFRTLPDDLGAETKIELTTDGIWLAMSLLFGPDVLAE